MNSLVIAKEYDKGHNEVLIRLRKLLKKEPRYREHIYQSSYINSRNREYPMFEFTEAGIEKVLDIFENCKISHSIDNEYVSFIKRMMPSLEAVEQYRIPNTSYTVDLAYPLYGVYIEIDGEYHNSKSQIIKDNQRISEIKKALYQYKKEELYEEQGFLMGEGFDYNRLFKVIIIKEGFLPEAISEILASLEETETTTTIFEILNIEPFSYYDEDIN